MQPKRPYGTVFVIARTMQLGAVGYGELRQAAGLHLCERPQPYSLVGVNAERIRSS